MKHTVRTTVALAATIAVVCVLCPAAVPIAASQANAESVFSIRVLPGLSSGGTEAFGINDRGQIVGQSDTPTGAVHAVLWDGVRITDLGASTHAIFSSATAINQRGQIAGYRIAAGTTIALLWENGTFTELGTLGGEHSMAHDINDLGQIVGQSWTAIPANEHAFLWQNGTMTDLGTLPGGHFSNARAINNRGQIVGDSRAADGKVHAVLWENGRIADLGVLLDAPVDSSATDISSNGQIVGWMGDGLQHALLWQRGTAVPLGTLPGATETSAIAINDRGQIVGFRRIPVGTFAFTHATLWQGTEVLDLGKLSADVGSRAWDINARGEIVGSSTDASFHNTAVVWTTGSVR